MALKVVCCCCGWDAGLQGRRCYERMRENRRAERGALKLLEILLFRYDCLRSLRFRLSIALGHTGSASLHDSHLGGLQVYLRCSKVKGNILANTLAKQTLGRSTRGTTTRP